MALLSVDGVFPRGGKTPLVLDMNHFLFCFFAQLTCTYIPNTSLPLSQMEQIFSRKPMSAKTGSTDRPHCGLHVDYERVLGLKRRSRGAVAESCEKHHFLLVLNVLKVVCPKWNRF